ncbi:glycoside hydrolase family 19 protein [Actinobacillus vicugnae]|uniref:glycoside hydrolase family 19 protein n=1 Tax=Actinobacillus vicugnae TaxID=2573093 RepID=UPI001240098F|nr:glycoside hydrolase family 19 protein [Actinobacillus vicugnae]
MHLLAQAKQETTRFLKFREVLNYTRKTYTAEKLYNLSPTIINQGFERRGMHYSKSQKLEYIDKKLLGNDKAYGEHCYGGFGKYPNKDYRGRGLIHLTHYLTYNSFYEYSKFDVLAHPELLENNYLIAIESALWFWNVHNKIGKISDLDTPTLTSENCMKNITRKVNKGLDGYYNRVFYKEQIKKIFFDMYGSCK